MLFDSVAQDASGEKVGMRALPSWLAAAVGTAEVRARGGEQAGVLRGAPVRDGCTDRFALGITAACLRLCRPFLAGQPQHLARLSWKYYPTHPERYAPLAKRQLFYRAVTATRGLCPRAVIASLCFPAALLCASK